MISGTAKGCFSSASVGRSCCLPLTRWSVTSGMAGVLVALFCMASANARTVALSGEEFQSWIGNIKPRLAAQGISRPTLDRAFSGLTLNKRILSLLSNQPEHSRTAGSYVSSLVSVKRISTGRDKLFAHRALLRDVGKRFQVDPTVVLAIWGIETSFGRITGKSGVIRSLATLAASDTRRTKFWTKELVAALKILDSRDVEVASMTGSWAGAMGHTQFMPTTYHTFAVDFDGDGRRDIWNSLDDALASTANYLKKSGWKSGQPWGFEVILPEGFDFSFAAADQRGDLKAWRARGVVPARGPGWPQASGNLSLVLPSGASGPAFLVSKNFKAIKRYNPSTLYALAVGQLADSIAGAPGLYTDWPGDDVALSRSERVELQELLGTVYGDIGKADGIIGRRTRAAIFEFQKSRGLLSDGYANKTLLLRLRLDVSSRRATGPIRHPRLSDASGR